MQQRRETQDLHAFLSLWLHQREMSLQPLRDSSGNLHHAEHVLKSRMLRCGVNKIRQAQLLASVKALKSRRLNDAHFVAGEFYISMHAVPNDFLHWFHRASSRMGLTCSPKFSIIWSGPLQIINQTL